MEIIWYVWNKLKEFVLTECEIINIIIYIFWDIDILKQRVIKIHSRILIMYNIIYFIYFNV